MNTINSYESNGPILSVVMCVYNTELYIKECIDSILNQTFTDLEFIIVNDGSTDESLNIIESYDDSRIKLLDNITNRGIIYSANRGIEEAKGKYIARMDSDDISLLNRFEKQIEYLEKNKEVGLLATLSKLIDKDNNQIGYWNEDKNYISSKEIFNYLPQNNCLVQSTIIAKSGFFKKYKYRPEQYLSEDYDLWLRLAADGVIMHKINEELLCHRILGSSFTRKLQRNVFFRHGHLKLEFVKNAIMNKKLNLFILKTGWYCFIDYTMGIGKEIKRKIIR